jgi:hypothetical protein
MYFGFYLHAIYPCHRSLLFLTIYWHCLKNTNCKASLCSSCNFIRNLTFLYLLGINTNTFPGLPVRKLHSNKINSKQSGLIIHSFIHSFNHSSVNHSFMLLPDSNVLFTELLKYSGWWTRYFVDHGGCTNCLPSLEHWDRGFESQSRHGCLFAFILCLCCSVCR